MHFGLLSLLRSRHGDELGKTRLDANVPLAEHDGRAVLCQEGQFTYRVMAQTDSRPEHTACGT